MNLKRALLTAAALAALPVAAIAQTTSSSFEVNVSFDPDLDKTTTVYISCNGGVPLEQQKSGLGDGDSVTFIVAETDANTDCDIWADDVAGYSVAGGNDPACSYENVGEGADNTGEDACYIDFEADDVRFTVTKTWDITNAGGDLLDPSYSITVTCDEEIVDDSGYATCTQDNLSCEFDGSGTANASFWVDIALAGIRGDGSVHCNAVESVVDSAVDSDQGCESGVNIGVGGSGACTITNEVFYEGIPTLSQYGLALMALLMLGVGFIGFRRLV